jgi:hypothetical protein
VYLKDCLDHADSVLSSLELFMSSCDKLVDYVFNTTNFASNETMKILTYGGSDVACPRWWQILTITSPRCLFFAHTTAQSLYYSCLSQVRVASACRKSQTG